MIIRSITVKIPHSHVHECRCILDNTVLKTTHK